MHVGTGYGLWLWYFQIILTIYAGRTHIVGNLMSQLILFIPLFYKLSTLSSNLIMQTKMYRPLFYEKWDPGLFKLFIFNKHFMTQPNWW